MLVVFHRQRRRAEKELQEKRSEKLGTKPGVTFQPDEDSEIVPQPKVCLPSRGVPAQFRMSLPVTSGLCTFKCRQSPSLASSSRSDRHTVVKWNNLMVNQTLCFRAAAQVTLLYLKSLCFFCDILVHIICYLGFSYFSELMSFRFL